MSHNNKSYIGDGVYVEFDGFGLVLTTENGISTTNRIVLEPEVYGALVEFVAVLREQNSRSAGAAGSLGDCVSCDGYVLDASEAPYCPSCSRERQKAVK